MDLKLADFDRADRRRGRRCSSVTMVLCNDAVHTPGLEILCEERFHCGDFCPSQCPAQAIGRMPFVSCPVDVHTAQSPAGCAAGCLRQRLAPLSSLVQPSAATPATAVSRPAPTWQGNAADARVRASRTHTSYERTGTGARTHRHRHTLVHVNVGRRRVSSTPHRHHNEIQFAVLWSTAIGFRPLVNEDRRRTFPRTAQRDTSRRFEEASQAGGEDT
eukprot:4577180-Pleurochrysis_carterae.AAC.2